MADTAEQTENQEQEKSTEQKSTEQKSTEQKDGDNQKAIDEAIAKAKAEWEKELEQKLKDAENEGMRKAKLTNEQRKKRTTTRNEKNLKKQRQSLNVKNRCICRNGTCQSRTVRRDCKVHHSRGQG